MSNSFDISLLMSKIIVIINLLEMLKRINFTKLSIITIFIISTVLLGGCGTINNTIINGDNIKEDNSLNNSNKVDTDKEPALTSNEVSGSDDQTDDWNYLENKLAGIKIRYPSNVVMDDSEGDIKLTLNVELIDELEGTMGFDKDTAITNKEALLAGVYGEDVDFPFDASKKVVEVDGIKAQDFIVFGRFEICDARFERKLYLFNNDYQIVLSLSLDSDKAISSLPEYFTLNKENCGEEKIWNIEKQDELYSKLVLGEDLGVVSDWFNTFDSIIKTIEIGDDSITQELRSDEVEKEGDLTITEPGIEEVSTDEQVSRVSNVDTETVGLPNPASAFCVENGGTVEIITDDTGSIGMCNFENGNMCEEWTFFRGECKKGDTL